MLAVKRNFVEIIGLFKHVGKRETEPTVGTYFLPIIHAHIERAIGNIDLGRKAYAHAALRRASRRGKLVVFIRKMRSDIEISCIQTRAFR